MSKLEFETVIVIGFGKIAQDVASTLLQYDVTLKLLQTELQPFSTLESFAQKHDITYQFKCTKEEIESSLLKWLSGKTLIISANNNYLFKGELLALNDVTIINFHNALLPNLRGRNAPSWAIYHHLEKTGVTWHYVDEGVDTGGAFAFSDVLIDKHDKAYQVAHKCMLAGLEAFSNVISELLEAGFVPCLAKKPLEYDYLYLSKDIPGNGWIDTMQSTIDNYRILRALDYGPFNVFPKAQINNDGTYYTVRTYQFIDEPNGKYLNTSENSIVLSDKFGSLKLQVEKAEIELR
ncbi:formyltransferase family protein [Shewanella algae]|uniref:formyltransferase family protein n=3 Tax=Shewanella algae TaxID=38313 RepID=UPI0012FD843E|nr:formyltransferase family protein [Shewanella algae]